MKKDNDNNVEKYLSEIGLSITEGIIMRLGNHHKNLTRKKKGNVYATCP